jgi:hypothetical protein
LSASSQDGTNAPNTFKQFWGDKDFTDVTLATADDGQIKAHKVIISLCSPFFRNIFVKNSHPNPLIYLKGVSHEHLENAMKFIYLGQCDVRDEDISAFLAIAVELGITGLMEGSEEETEVQQGGVPKNPEYNQTDYHPNQAKVEPVGEAVKHQIVPPVRQADGRFRCNMCDKDYAGARSLNLHKQAKHEGLGYGCDQCAYTASQQVHLATHKQVKHEGVRYGCDQCDYKATRPYVLIKHKRKKCGYKPSAKKSLSTHKQLKHERLITNGPQGEPDETSSLLIGRFRRFIRKISPAGTEPEIFPELEAVLLRDIT